MYVIFTSLLLVLVSCVGRRGADDSDANVSEDPPYILPLRSSIEAPTMSPPPSPSFGLPPHLPFVSPKCRDQIRPREFHVHFSTCLRNARGHLCLHLPNPSNVLFVHGNVEGGSLHQKKYETFAGETDRSEKERQPSRPSRPMDMRDGESLSRPINAITFLKPPWPAAY